MSCVYRSTPDRHTNRDIQLPWFCCSANKCRVDRALPLGGSRSPIIVECFFGRKRDEQIGPRAFIHKVYAARNKTLILVYCMFCGKVSTKDMALSTLKSQTLSYSYTCHPRGRKVSARWLTGTNCLGKPFHELTKLLAVGAGPVHESQVARVVQDSRKIHHVKTVIPPAK